MRILIVEDERKVALALEEGLRREHFTATIAPTGEEGFFLLNSQDFDLMILDLTLPGHDGLEVLRALRQKKFSIPVLVLTARDSLEDRVEGLESGADDYLVKPFAFPELLARIRALLRRGPHEHEPTLALGDLELDVQMRSVRRGNRQISLTARELELLEYLLRHKNAIVSREMLARDVWRVSIRATPLDNVIDVHITHLRSKVDEPFETKLLHTIRGVGFMLSEKNP
jgi:DNA-binding response OmpR family regulator